MEIKSLKPFEFIIRQDDKPCLEILKVGRWEIALLSRMNPHKGKCNEDAMAVIDLGEKGFVLVVADGAGGYPQADIASRSACEAIAEHLISQAEASEDSNGLREWVPGAIDLASAKVKARAPQGRTTLTVGVVDGDQIRSYQVGDSELIVCGQRGRIKHRTQSHSPVGYAVASGDLDEKEALHHPDRHLVSNFVGDASCRVEVSAPVPLQSRDTVLLASDGLFDNFLAEDLVNEVRAGALQERAVALAMRIDLNFSEEGTKALKFDDVSVIIAKRTFGA